MPVLGRRASRLAPPRPSAYAPATSCVRWCVHVFLNCAFLVFSENPSPYCVCRSLSLCASSSLPDGYPTAPAREGWSSSPCAARRLIRQLYVSGYIYLVQHVSLRKMSIALVCIQMHVLDVLVF